MTTVEFSWVPEADDLADALRANRRFLGRWRYLTFPLGFVAVVLVSAVLALFSGYPDHSIGLIALSLPMVWLTVRLLRDPGPQAHRMFRRRAAFREPVTLVVSDEGLRFTTATASRLYPWPALVAFTETDHTFVIGLLGSGKEPLARYVAYWRRPGVPTPVPKRGAAVSGDVDRLRETLVARFAGRKALQFRP